MMQIAWLNVSFKLLCITKENYFRMSAIPVLIPLTVDRFVALVFPMRYKSFMTKTNCRIMVALTWIVLIPIVIVDIVTLSNKSNEVHLSHSVK